MSILNCQDCGETVSSKNSGILESKETDIPCPFCGKTMKYVRISSKWKLWCEQRDWFIHPESAFGEFWMKKGNILDGRPQKIKFEEEQNV